MNLNPLAAEEQFLNPLDRVNGFDIRPGLYEINGATSFGSCVNFTIHSQNAVSCELLLFHRGEKEPYGTIPFPENYRIGRVYSMIVFGLDIYDFEYAYRMDGPNVPEKGLIYDKTKVLLDPYARAVTQQSIWGKEPDREKGYHGRVVFNDFDWGDAREPKKPMQELIIYEMHVRGFTKHASSGVQFPGTFEGIREKIPYLKALGITAVELMPVFEFDETMGKREIGGRTLLDYEDRILGSWCGTGCRRRRSGASCSGATRSSWTSRCAPPCLRQRPETAGCGAWRSARSSASSLRRS